MNRRSFLALPLPLLLCGKERWSEKVLSDPGSLSIRFNSIPLTIQDIQTLPPFPHHPEARTGGEFQAYQVSGIVTVIRHETDEDLHVVLADGGDTVIVEFPSESCAEASRFPSLLRTARRVGDGLVVGERITVIGSLFYDFPHHQIGMSRPCIEIHPVMWCERETLA